MSATWNAASCRWMSAGSVYRGRCTSFGRTVTTNRALVCKMCSTSSASEFLNLLHASIRRPLDCGTDSHTRTHSAMMSSIHEQSTSTSTSRERACRWHTQTHRDTDTQTHRHTDTQRHRDTETRRHRHTSSASGVEDTAQTSRTAAAEEEYSIANTSTGREPRPHTRLSRSRFAAEYCTRPHE